MKNDTRQHQEFLQMLRQCEGTIVKVCLCFTNRQADEIRDLYQEIACTLWEAWPSFRGGSDPNTWVTSIALNVAAQEKRRRKQLPQFVELDESLYDSLADEASDQRYRRLYELIDRLGDEDRKLLFLYLDRKRLREIAKMTGYSETAVKQRLYRIKKKLITLNQDLEI